jgi:hypothetical protein
MSAAGTGAPVTYFYLITLQWTLGPGAAQARTASGQVSLGKGSTRQGAFSTILAATRKSLGPAAAGAVVLFFSLEPDDLPGAGDSRPGHRHAGPAAAEDAAPGPCGHCDGTGYCTVRDCEACAQWRERTETSECGACCGTSVWPVSRLRKLRPLPATGGE